MIKRRFEVTPVVRCDRTVTSKCLFPCEEDCAVNHDSTGKLLKKMAAFSLPLILSGLLQQLFNWADALIVGNFVGEHALGGVGATSSVYNLFVTILIGFTSGLSVLFAQQYGQKRADENRTVLARHSVALTSVFFVIAVLGMIFVKPILRLMDTPESLLPYAEDYLRIILIGIPFLALYNTYSALLRGMGNSRVPFVAVLISSVVNVGLDYLFAVRFQWGVSGAATATVLSQAAMTGYVVLYTVITFPEFRFSPFKRSAYSGERDKGASFGMPPAVQGSVSSVGNVILQKFMNGFGEHTVSAITTAYRIDTVLLLPIVNFSTAISTLVAQETGAEQPENARKIFRIGSIVMLVLSAFLAGTILMTGKFLLGMFGLTAESVAIGTSFFRSLSVFYLVYGLSMSIKGYLEGISDLLISGLIGIGSLVIRILCSYGLAPLWGNRVIAYAEMIAWLFLLGAYLLRYWGKSRSVGNKKSDG